MSALAIDKLVVVVSNMSTIKIADELDFDGINEVISANNSNSEDVYKFPYLYDNFRDILPSKSQLIFVTKEHGNVIAFLNLHNSDLYHNCSKAEFEIVIHPAYRDPEKHLGENILKFVINYVKDKTQVDILSAKVLKKNVPSINLLQKIGFSSETVDGDSIGYEMNLKISR
jgi:RimJ/RimL family protein N-acetyltransferase